MIMINVDLHPYGECSPTAICDMQIVNENNAYTVYYGLLDRNKMVTSGYVVIEHDRDESVIHLIQAATTAVAAELDKTGFRW